MTQTLVRPVGTFDHADPVLQMRAIDLVLRHYFNTPGWLRARRKQRSNELRQ
jgi:hypothetical protein